MKRPSAQMLLSAYCQGVFPMAHEDRGNEIFWYAPDPRAVIPLDDAFHVPKRLAQRVRRQEFEVRFSTAFEQVIRACSAPRSSEDSTWISSGIIDAYTELHTLGFAHSVEAWQEGELVGGLYGVAVGGLFAGESMFSARPNASKVCLVHLVQRLRERGFLVLDTQFMTEHLRRFGAHEIPREDYEALVARAIELDCTLL